MAEGGLPGPAPHGEDPPPQPTPQPLPLQPGQQVHMHMNWSHFKPEYSGKPEEDVEAHLLRTDDWMNTWFPWWCKSSKILSDTNGRS